MEQNKISIKLLPHTPFLKEDGKFDKKTAIEYSAKLAGECYEPEGFEKLKNEPEEKTNRRVNQTLGMEHQTPYEHVNIGMEIVNLPKILAMVLNNEKQYTTSEKSARYTQIDPSIDPNLSEKEGILYNKWIEIFKVKITEQYGNCFNSSKITKLAQENARYLVSVFASTKMIHTLPWIQLNRIVGYMNDYLSNNYLDNSDFNIRLMNSFREFIDCLDNLDILDERAMTNRKHRKLSLFDYEKIDKNEFGYTYAVEYKGSFAELAQAQRHRTLEYTMKLDSENKQYFIPPILLDDQMLVDEWINDINSVWYANPQGELVNVTEKGSYDNFILKCKERLCSAAQQEIEAQTKETLQAYKKALEEINHPKAQDIKEHSYGARCTFKDYDCNNDCKFNEGKILTRRI